MPIEQKQVEYLIFCTEQFVEFVSDRFPFVEDQETCDFSEGRKLCYDCQSHGCLQWKVRNAIAAIAHLKSQMGE